MINPKAEELQHDELPVQNPPPSYTPIAERGATSTHTAPPPSIAMPVPNVTNTPSRQHEPPSMGRSQQYAPPLAHSQGYPPPNLKPPQPPTPKTAAQIGEEYKASLLAECAHGRHDRKTKYGVAGIIAGVLLFPIGLICLFIDTEGRCTRCGVRLD